MKPSFIFITLLVLGASCSHPINEPKLSAIVNSLASQKHLYYEVEYKIKHSDRKSASNLFGLVYLNRSAERGISSAFFGLEKDKPRNFLQSIYLKNEWIYNISSQRFDLEDSDVITDSLHSPVLINPALISKLKKDSKQISYERITPTSVKWIFDFRNKPDQMMMVWNAEHNVIEEIEYKYNIHSDRSYSRKWSFKYMAEDQYKELASISSKKQKVANQTFL